MSTTYFQAAVFCPSLERHLRSIERVYVVYFDASVQKVDVYIYIYMAGQPIHLEPIGGGGTDFWLCFDWVRENYLQPQIFVFLTDLYGTLPDNAPAVPVVWASTGSQRAAFGQVVPMQSA